MSPSFDISATSLLCEEEEDFSLFSDMECSEPAWHDEDRRLSGGTDEVNGGDSSNEFPVQSDECVMQMVKREIEHLGESDYFSRFGDGDLDLDSRNEAICWIFKVIVYYNFGPLCAYLAVSYLDRFLSAFISPEKRQDWMMQLSAVGCLSLAAKMEENEVPLSLDLQVADCKYIFEAKTIQRMELLVLSTLKWRMQAITPFSFIDHFLYKINGEKNIPKSAITSSTQLIVNTLRGIEFLEYRPSEIAAAVAVSVGLETQTVEMDKSIHILIEYVKKDRVLKCIEMIHEISLRRGPDEGLYGDLTSCVPHSPICVLDNTCFSYISDESSLGSCANSSHISLGTKRRKLAV